MTPAPMSSSPPTAPRPIPPPTKVNSASTKFSTALFTKPSNSPTTTEQFPTPPLTVATPIITSSASLFALPITVAILSLLTIFLSFMAECRSRNSMNTTGSINMPCTTGSSHGSVLRKQFLITGNTNRLDTDKQTTAIAFVRQRSTDQANQEFFLRVKVKSADNSVAMKLKKYDYGTVP